MNFSIKLVKLMPNGKINYIWYIKIQDLNKDTYVPGKTFLLIYQRLDKQEWCYEISSNGIDSIFTNIKSSSDELVTKINFIVYDPQDKTLSSQLQREKFIAILDSLQGFEKKLVILSKH